MTSSSPSCWSSRRRRGGSSSASDALRRPSVTPKVAAILSGSLQEYCAEIERRNELPRRLLGG